MSVQAGYVEINGARLYYAVTGEGVPLTLLHAGIADHTMWDDQVEAFAAEYRVIRPDLRGFGQSHMPDEPFSLVNDLYGVLCHLNIEKTHLVGVSLGGSTAISFALTHPDIVRSLTLVGSGVNGIALPAGVPPASWDEISAAEKSGDVARAVELEIRMWVDGPQRTPEQVSTRVRERIRRIETRNFANANNGGHAHSTDAPSYAHLAEIQAPTLVIVGDYDLPSVVYTADVIANTIPGAQKAVIHGVAHLPNMERPDEFNETVLDFLRNI